MSYQNSNITNSNCIAIEEIWPYCNLVLNWDTTSAAVNVRNNPARIGWVKSNISAGRMRTPCPCGTLVCVSAFSQCFSLGFCRDHLSLYPYVLHVPHLTLPLLGLKQQCQHDFALEALFCTLFSKKFFVDICKEKKKQRFKVELFFFFHFKDTPAVNIFHFQNVFDMFIEKK